MKKIILFPIAMLMFTIAINAQGPWQGFPFKPLQSLELPSVREEGVNPYRWIFRPAVELNTTAIDLKADPITTQPLSSGGAGLSFGKYIDNNGDLWCSFSVNAVLMTGIRLNGQEVDTQVGIAGFVDVLNKFFGIGVGWWPGGRVVVLTTFGIPL